jgi:mRNA export factor
VKWSEQNQMLITGSWDNTIKFWDVKSNKCSETYKFDDKVICMDVKYDYLVVGTADRKFTTFDLHQTSKPTYIQETPLKFQTRCVSIFSDGDGYIAGSIEGRCAVQYFMETSSNFAFKCHRQGNAIYPVNSIDVNDKYGTFATGGGGKSSFHFNKRWNLLLLGQRKEEKIAFYIWSKQFNFCFEI